MILNDMKLFYFIFWNNYRVNMLTKKSEEMANASLSGVLKVLGFITSSIVNSFVGKKFFSLLPGQVVLASLDGFSKSFFLLFCIF